MGGCSRCRRCSRLGGMGSRAVVPAGKKALKAMPLAGAAIVLAWSPAQVLGQTFRRQLLLVSGLGLVLYVVAAPRWARSSR